MSRTTSGIFALLVACLVAAPVASAQLVAPTEVEFPEGFGLLTSVRELPDGSVLVADPLGQILAALDLDTGTMDLWGREGGGPQEYRTPDAVHALPGDSTLLVDLGNGRLTVIDPDGRFTRTRPIALGGASPVGPRRGGPGGPGGMQMILPRSVDGQGRIYFTIRSFQSPGDSSSIARVGQASDEVERIAKLKPQDVSRSGGGGNVMIRPVPMSPQDDWAVGPDGSIALVRSDGYYVQVMHADGRISTGPTVDHEQIRPRDAEKQAWLDGLAASGISVQITVQDGQRQMRFGRGGGGPGGDADLNSYDWPNRMPAFRSGSSRIDPEGRIWVGRTTRAGAPSLFDVFDDEGRPIGQVELDPNTSIVGFGADGAMYTTRTDDLGLQWLQRRRVG